MVDFDNLSYAVTGVKRLVVVAPNWLGDAVMALPAIADVRRGAAGAAIDVAARPSVAPLFTLVDGVRDVVVARAPQLGHARFRGRSRRPVLRRGAAAAELVSIGADRLARRHSAALGLPDRSARGAADLGDRRARAAGIRPPTISIWLASSGSRAAPSSRASTSRRRCARPGADLLERRRVGRHDAAGGGCAGRGVRRRQAVAGRLVCGRGRRTGRGRRGRGPRRQRRRPRGGGRGPGRSRCPPRSNLVGRTDLPALAGVLANCRGARVERLRRDALRRGARPGGDGDVRSDRRVGDAAARPEAAGRPDPRRLVPSLHAARVSARSSLHARDHGRHRACRGKAGDVTAAADAARRSSSIATAR